MACVQRHLAWILQQIHKVLSCNPYGKVAINKEIKRQCVLMAPRSVAVVYLNLDSGNANLMCQGHDIQTEALP